MGHFLDTEEHRQAMHDLFPGMQFSEEENTLFVDNGSGKGPVPWLSFDASMGRNRKENPSPHDAE